MKRLLSMLASITAAFLLTACIAAPAFATTLRELDTTYVQDHYELLSDARLQQLENQAAQLSDQYQCNVYLLIVDNIGNYTQRQFAETYWNTFGLGRGTDKDGILFLIAVDSRDYVTITHGQGTHGGITIFTDHRIEQIEDDIVSELKNDNWVAGCQVYLDDVSDTLSFYAENGEPWDVDNDPETAKTVRMMKIIVTIVLPLVIAAIVCIVWARQMRTARLKREANDYLQRDSFVLTTKQDIFLHTTRTRVKVQSEDHSGGGGGSTISASGFGGSSGGKF